jgi:hypothetical protein
VVALPQPSSLAGSRFQGVEVRAINSNAATQLRSGTWRGTPPRGGGSRGWMRAHSWLGSSRSTGLVMAADHPTTSLNYPNHAAASFRNVH